MDLTIIVPTYNEAPNIRELVRRVTNATRGIHAELLFVDDSTDNTPDVISETALSAQMTVRLIHRDRPEGGLGGAVMAGVAAAAADACLVMDGDLQHPPEKIPEMVERLGRGDVDVVVASRYAEDGSAHGLAGGMRVLVSRASTVVARAMFPIRLRTVSDPMTGFFLIDRRVLAHAALQPRGFKILLEILARTPLRATEVPFTFAPRFDGASKASFMQGVHFLRQLVALRFGKMSSFALVGALGAVANVGIVWLLTSIGMNYVAAAIIAAELTIVGNFLLIERVVFQDVKLQASGVWSRFAKSFAFNNIEAVVRIPIMAMMVSTTHISSVVATAITLAAAFFVRFLFHSLVVYAPRKTYRAESASTERAEPEMALRSGR